MNPGWLVALSMLILPFSSPLIGADHGTTEWESPGSADIRPGVRIGGSTCTSNFIFTDSAHTTVYIGLAAHCVATGPSTVTNGCSSQNRPDDIGSKVQISGASKMGTLVYSSWETMQRIDEPSTSACAGNDFAVVEIHPDDHDEVNPALLVYGGPTGVTGGNDHGSLDRALTYGNSATRVVGGPVGDQLKAREGYSTSSNGGWTTNAYFYTPGIPGDSGSAVLSDDGSALGVLVTVSGTASNGITNLYRALDYANDEGGMDLRLATWDQLDPGLFPDI